ncbi:MAG: hypothetical protein NC548_27260 [Lachnospiraceae bacterium]|nr:hypothetical protein [Lachnospiraceae bacterium]
MTNPNNAIGTNGAFGGRTSPNALNDVLSAFPGRGVLSGWRVKTAGVMTLQLGGNGSNRDVAIAMDNLGNKTTVNNITNSPVTVSLPEAPEVGYRVDLIVAYVNNPPQGTTTAIDNPAACGLVVVSGSSAVSNPAEPTETDIRTAITADGASGTTAYYVVLAKATVANTKSVVVTQGTSAALQNRIAASTVLYDYSHTSQPAVSITPGLYEGKTNLIMAQATIIPQNTSSAQGLIAYGNESLPFSAYGGNSTTATIMRQRYSGEKNELTINRVTGNFLIGQVFVTTIGF